MFGTTETNIGAAPSPYGAASSADAGATANAPASNGATKTNDDARATYSEYSAEAVAQAQAEGRPVVLYFWASWCPICRAEEPKLKAMIEGSSVSVAGFRVNFDTEKDLKAKFRVPYQHTTIIFDADGNESARFTGPVAEAELTAALAAAAQ